MRGFLHGTDSILSRIVTLTSISAMQEQYWIKKFSDKWYLTIIICSIKVMLVDYHIVVRKIRKEYTEYI